MQVASNPFKKNPQELLSLLRTERDRLMRNFDAPEEQQFDRAAFEKLKQQLANSPTLKVIPPKEGGTI